MPQRKKPVSKAKKTALGGVFGALAVVIMLVGGFMPFATFTAPIFSSLCLIPVLVEIGAKTAFIVYLSVCTISFFIVPDHEMLLLFVLLCGYYPIIKPYLDTIKPKFAGVVLKLIICVAAIAATYLALFYIFLSPGFKQELQDNSVFVWGITVVSGLAVFLMYDILIEKMRLLYIYRIRGKIL